MRNKFSSNLLQKGLISLAAASVLATSSFGVDGTYEGTIQDFRITMDKTTVEKTTSTVNVVVEVLDVDGKVDILSTDTATLTINSILGEIIEAADVTGGTTSRNNDLGQFGDTNNTTSSVVTTLDFEKGKAGFSIFYPESAKIGTDTVRFTLKVEDADDSNPSIIFPSVDKTIVVTNPSNQAVGLEILAIEPINNDCISGSCKKTDYASNVIVDATAPVLGTKGNIRAGEAFSVKIQAITEEDNTSNTGDAQYTDASTIFQNSTVTLSFIELLNDDGDSNVEYKTVTGKMVEGVVFIDVPAEFMTEDGNFTMKATTPTTLATADSDYTAESNNSYQIYIHAAAPAGVTAVANSGDDQITASTTSSENNASIRLTLTDKYGNAVTSASSLEDSYTVSASINSEIAKLNDNNGSGTVTSTTSTTTSMDIKFASTTDVATDLNVSSQLSGSLSVDDNGMATGVVTFTSSDLEVLNPTVSIPIYTTSVDLNWSAQTYSGTVVNDNLNYITGAGFSLVTGNLYENMIELYGLEEAVKVTVEVLDEDNESVVASSTAYSSFTNIVGTTGDGNVSIRFTQALTSAQIGAVRVVVDGQNSDLNDTFIAEINTTVASSLGIYKLTDYEASTRASKFTQIDSIAYDLYENGDVTENNITFDTNISVENLTANFDADTPKYFLLLSDVYNNPIASGSRNVGSIILATDSGNLTPDFYHYQNNDATKTISVETNDTIGVEYSSIGVDNLVFTSTVPGIDQITIPVTLTDSSPKLESIQIVAGSDYLLINGEMAVSIKVLNDAGNGFNIADDSFSVVISNPNLITLRDGKRDNGGFNYDNGAFLNCDTSTCTDNNDTIALSLTASNSVGDVDVTIRNTTGTISATKTLHIVSSTASIVGVVESVTASPASMEISSGTSVDVTFTVTDDAGNALADKSLKILSDNSGIIVMDKIATTDESGLVTVTLTSVGSLGSVNISATAEGKSGSVVIDVVAAAIMTISTTDATIAEAEQETITITNPAKTLTSDDITNTDDSVVTASLVDGNVVLTATAAGTATITVTDGTTTETINVTVEAGLVTGPVSDISSLGQSAYQTELNIANKNAYVTKNADGSLTVNNKMSVAITDTEITITPTGDYAGYTVKYIELKEGTAPKLRVIEEYIQISDTQYLKVTLEEAAVVAPTTAMTPALVAGWNLLGNASNASQTVAKTGISVTWTFDGAWTQDGDVPAGQGFWAKADADIAGYEFANSGDGTSMPTFTAGTWSLMAATMSETLADVLASKTDATIVWSFTDSTWSSDGATTIEAGQGYWVK